MPRAAFSLLLILLCAPRAVGEEPTRPKNVAEAVARARAAHAAGDKAALAALAALEDPDPWRVAEELCHQRETATAKALATARKAPAVAALPAYVAACGARPPRPESRRADRDTFAALNRGDWKAALAATERAKPRRDSVFGIRTLAGRGWAYRKMGRHRESAQAFRAAAEAAEALGWLTRASSSHHLAGNAAFRSAAWQEALTSWDARVAVERRLGDEPALGRALNNLGAVRERLGQIDAAIAAHTEAIAIRRRLGAQGDVAVSLNTLGGLAHVRGRYGDALRLFKEAEAIKRTQADVASLARTVNNIGAAYTELGNYPEALRYYEEALALRKRLKDVPGTAAILNNIGSLHEALGAYAKALARFEESLRIAGEAGDERGVARALHNLGHIHLRFGQHEQALARFEASLVRRQRIDDKPGRLLTLNSMGLAHKNLGALDRAKAKYEEALKLAEALGDRITAALVHANLGVLRVRAGDHAGARAHYRAALEHHEALDDRVRAAAVWINLGSSHTREKQWAPAEEAYGHAERILETLPDPVVRVHLLWGRAHLRLGQGRAQDAAARAREGVRLVAGLGVQLSDEESIGVRDVLGGMFDVATEAALATRDAEQLTYVLEQQRGGTLRGALGSRSALEAAVLPAPLSQALEAGRREERAALRAVDRALRSRRLKQAREARRRLERASQALAAVVARAEREAKAAAALTLSEPRSLAAIQATLAPQDALLLYALTDVRSAVLVVRRTDTRIVDLAPPAALHAAVGALLLHEQPYIDTQAVARVRALLGAPLKLPTSTTRVLVSPVGELGFVPFGLVFPERDVVYAPSGTTQALLRAAGAQRGARVLAIGDPVYTRMPRLPATRAEAKAVGDITLVGDKATEGGLWEAMRTQERWRAVHFACHGLLDPERPLFSSLALGADPENDGRLRCLDIFRRKVPADLVVLSACETGKGRVYKTEGIVGLTRAFMFAGAPRVLCSLWKVDDEATRALMVKFYELWNPKGGKGVNAARALREAQAYVRSRKKWAHPYYWAAWVLWGLAE